MKDYSRYTTLTFCSYLQMLFFPTSKPLNFQLYGVNDASIHAYSAVVYLKSAKIQIQLVASKIKIPLKKAKYSSSRAPYIGTIL